MEATKNDRIHGYIEKPYKRPQLYSDKQISDSLWYEYERIATADIGWPYVVREGITTSMNDLVKAADANARVR